MTALKIGIVGTGAIGQPMALRQSGHVEYDALATMVNAIGQERFAPALARYLYELCGADHFAAFQIGSHNLTQIAACCVDPERTKRARVASYVKQGWWKLDPAMTRAQDMLPASRAGIIQIDLSDRAYTTLRRSIYPDVRDRLLLCGRAADCGFGLSIVRSSDAHAPFGSNVIDRLYPVADLLLAVLAKHVDLCRPRPDVAQALTMLDKIEACIAATNRLPQREAEVCARVLYGVSSAGIALDLAVSEETVKTYRKRAYQRLAIGSERELLNWYLGQWSRWSARPIWAAQLH